MHSHHIFPKHIDPEGVFDSYQIKVTVEEHAEIHGLLFDEYWRWEDWLAWQSLSGQIDKEEIIKYAQRMGQLGKPKSEETKKKISITKKGQIPWMKGKKHTIESIEKNRISHLGKIQSVESNMKRRLKLKGIPKSLKTKIKMRKPKSLLHRENMKKAWILRKQKVA